MTKPNRGFGRGVRSESEKPSNPIPVGLVPAGRRVGRLWTSGFGRPSAESVVGRLEPEKPRSMPGQDEARRNPGGSPM